MKEQNQTLFAKPWVKQLLSQPLLARLATANPANCQPHVVPVWFLWDGESIYISAFSSTRKIKDVMRNPRIAVIVDTGEENPPTRAVLMEGHANILTDTQFIYAKSLEIYTHYLGLEGVKDPEPQSWIVDPENRIIKLTPDKVYIWGPKD